jgi:hypothetical protein
MKVNKLFIAIGMGVVSLMTTTSCQNEDQEFDNYKYNAVYFPYQYPVRTLELGEDTEVDTSDDNLLKFSFGCTLAGMYSNDANRTVVYTIDNTLTDSLYTSTGVQLLPLPRKYYTISNEGTITVPKGSMQGYATVQLTDEFLNDPLAVTTKYVIPVRIVKADVDTILSGKALVANADPRVASNWSTSPKNFMIYGIKYVNPWAASYLLRGADVYGANTVTYTNKYVERCDVVSLSTLDRNSVNYVIKVRQIAGAASPGNLSMILTFDANGACKVTSDSTSYAVVTGSGEFVKGGDSFGGKARNVLRLAYSYVDSKTNEKHNVKDTLVVRDRNIKIETFSPVVH